MTFPGKSKEAFPECVCLFLGMLKKMHYITEKYWQSTKIADNGVYGFGATEYLGVTALFISMRFSTSLHLFPLGFFSGRIGELQGLVHETISPPF